jgi:dynein heavy chain
LVYFLDDLNLPEVDKYNTQSAIALVREHFDYGHWYVGIYLKPFVSYC